MTQLMKSGRKRDDGAGGWTMIVTTQAGVELQVHQRRGAFRRNWFGNNQYWWSATVTWPDGHVEELASRQGAAGRYLAERGVRQRELRDQ